jgi:peptide/nickel transport system substrate-binding protein
MRSRLPLLLAGALAAAAPAAAQELRVGIRAALENPDPGSSYTPNRNIALQVYEPLMLQDAALKPVPGLAVSWRMRDPTTWEIKLRPEARFHDGSPLRAEDIAFTFRRNLAVEYPQTYRTNLREVTGVEAEDAATVIIRTRGPSPLLPYDLASFGIVSARAAAGASTNDFAGRAAIGTGPYRWVSFTPGQNVVLERNENYWGPRPHFARVDFRFVPNDSARTASLLSGDLDVVDALPAELVARVRDNDKTKIISTTAIMMLYLQLDTGRERTPQATGADGQPLPRNPLRDLRVRQAISHAINRAGIAERALLGTAEPAGQFMAPGLDGHQPDLAPVRYDPARSRALLAEAGYPQGFGLGINCTNDRYAGDARICQTLGQMLNAVGIRAGVETTPMSILIRRRAGSGPEGMELSAYMIGYGSPNGLATSALSSVVQTQDRASGRGGNNYSGYSNPELDRIITAAETELDDARRAELVREGTRIAINDTPIVPLLFTKSYWGVRRDLTLTPRADSLTFADTIRPAQ